MHGEFGSDLLPVTRIVISYDQMAVRSYTKFLAIGVHAYERERDPFCADRLIGVRKRLLGMIADGVDDPRLLGIPLTIGVAVQIEGAVTDENSVIRNIDRLILDCFPRQEREIKGLRAHGGDGPIHVHARCVKDLGDDPRRLPRPGLAGPRQLSLGLRGSERPQRQDLAVIHAQRAVIGLLVRQVSPFNTDFSCFPLGGPVYAEAFDLDLLLTLQAEPYLASPSFREGERPGISCDFERNPQDGVVFQRPPSALSRRDPLPELHELFAPFRGGSLSCKSDNHLVYRSKLGPLHTHVELGIFPRHLRQLERRAGFSRRLLLQ